MFRRSTGGRQQPDRSCPICAVGYPLDVIVELRATWVTAPAIAPLPGYVCIVSKVHAAEPFELRGETRHEFWEDVLAASEGVKTAVSSTKLNYEISGNRIEHLHLDLYPRYPGDPYEGRPIDAKKGLQVLRSATDLARLHDAIATQAAAARAGRPRFGEY